MKKNLRKALKNVVLFALACLLFVQAMVPVIAQPNVSGIDPDIPGSITIHRFAGSTAAAPTQGTPLNGIPYTIELVRLIPGIEPTAENLRNPDNFDPITGDGAFNATQSTVNGIANFENLPHGIFRVTEGAHTVTPAADRMDPFIVGIPRRSADGLTWVYDVDVFPKSEEDTILSLEKELEIAWDGELEEMVATWTLQTTIPRLIGNATRLEFVDELDERLTFIDAVGTYLRMEEDDGVVTQVEATLPASAFNASVGGNNVLSIALTQDGFNHLARYAILAPDGTLTFTVRTIIGTSESNFGPLTNAARLFYNDEDEIITYTPPPPEVLYGLEVEKVDVNRERLDGAVFELFLDANGSYPAFGNEAGVNREFAATNGVFLIPNLREGTFYLRETVAPPGHQLITDLMPVTINATSVNPERNYVITVQVINEVEAGFVLPETGGTGTLIFTAVGLVLIGGALSLALVAKRRRNEND